MPGEWSHHDACLILYPHNPKTFRLVRVQEEVINVTRAISKDGEEPVFLLCYNDEQASELKEQIGEEGIRIHTCPSDDTWARDTCPTLVWNSDTKQIEGLDWDFNAYGGPVEGCYWPCDKDQQIAKKVCQDILNVKCHAISIVLEGGSIHTDGEGTLLATEECLLNPNRNPQLPKVTIETTLKGCLGVSKVIWLPHGLDADEDTNGHVDNFCCFVKPGHVLLAWTDDNVNDAENYKRCRVAETVLSSTTDAKYRKLVVHKLGLPPPLYYTKEEAISLSNESAEAVGRVEGEKMAASYVNFYIANKAIILPQFGVPSDSIACDTIQALFPNRKVVGVGSREILLGGGNIHCITQQVPAPCSR
ncbi:unnamed protein product [Cylindrotheca closterium]|uniref:Agmatine deiminase n=1 Tax=Cylindrotheca closterium TaxID=2856 RepID=A0AAD2GDK0_9STRA|nr:unnamed protein product [Cylindrotheca closterium]